MFSTLIFGCGGSHHAGSEGVIQRLEGRSYGNGDVVLTVPAEMVIDVLGAHRVAPCDQAIAGGVEECTFTPTNGLTIRYFGQQRPAQVIVQGATLEVSAIRSQWLSDAGAIPFPTMRPPSGLPTWDEAVPPDGADAPGSVLAVYVFALPARLGVAGHVDGDGFVVTGLDPGWTPASSIGIQVGDVVLRADGRSLAGEEDASSIALLGSARTLHVRRGEVEHVVDFEAPRVGMACWRRWSTEARSGLVGAPPPEAESVPIACPLGAVHFGLGFRGP